MARLNVAAGLILLMCVALGPEQSQGQAPDIANLFPGGSLPPPVKIYSKLRPSLNIAKWYPLQGSSLSSTPLPFSLMNAKAFQVITIPTGRKTKQLGLSSTTDSPNAAREELWQPEASPSDKDGYYKLFVFKNTSMSLSVLTARGGGFVPGIYRASANANYLLWKIEPSPLCA
ncbi:hypothetical protein HU200_003070 [Digitaria exilis]|uniref:Uncharacterized protein n=1 Tax=Digitaria exilis TaxID=1010633 RepID=A0A835FXK1_9POAL|nr:hypothetical protein HU200_003070 [Digitaria exilis]